MSSWVSRPAEAEPVTFKLPAGSAVDTLQEFSRQANLRIYFWHEEIAGHQTRAVSGMLEPRDALEEMLQGSGLRYRFTDSTTIRVLPIATLELNETSLEEPELSTVKVSDDWYHGEIERPIGVTPLRITAAEIQASGAATPYDLLRTLPQVFGGGPTENTHNFGREAQSNSALGTGVNLRGLGAGATLILLNGRPLAPGGTVGAFTDISNIPLSAIDHVDIMTDGGSILYGPASVGGVVNFVLRNTQGFEIGGRLGGRASESIGERQLNLSYGRSDSDGHLTVAYEYYGRDGLWASERAQATSNLRQFGGENFDTMAGSPGTLLFEGQTWAIPANPNGHRLVPQDFVAGTQNLYNLLDDATILPFENLQSLMAGSSRRVGEHWTLFLDALASCRHVHAQEAAETAALTVTSANPFYVNPTGSSAPEQVEYGFLRDLGPLELSNVVNAGQFTVGADYTGIHGWYAEAYAGYSLETQNQLQSNRVNYSALATALLNPDPSRAFNPFVDGSQSSQVVIAAIRAENRFHLRSTIAFANATATGSPWTLPAGDMTLTLGTDIRRQSFAAQTLASGQVGPLSDNLSRDIFAVFAKATLPLLAGSTFPKRPKLEFSAGLRYEHYSDIGSVTTPQIGFAAPLSSSVTLQGTWARLFKAPNLGDLAESSNVSAIEPLPDPQSSTGVSNVLLLAGNSSSLQAERARSWTLGLNFSPAFHRNASLALTYFHTKFSNLVANPPDLTANALTDPTFGPFVTRNISAQARAGLCAQSQFLGLPDDCSNLPIAALIDLRLQNLGVIETSGIDLNTRYVFEPGVSQVTLGLLGTYLLSYSEASSPLSPLTSVLNTEHNPIDLRLRGSVAWKWGPLKAFWFVNYQAAYRDVASVPTRHVSSWTTADATVTYEFQDSAFFQSKGLSVSMSALNLLNRNPPFLNNRYEKIGYDQENGDLVGRALSLTVRKRW